MSFRFGEGDVSMRDEKRDLKKKKLLSCFCFCFLRSIGFYNLYLVEEKRNFFF